MMKSELLKKEGKLQIGGFLVSFNILYTFMQIQAYCDKYDLVYLYFMILTVANFMLLIVNMTKHQILV
jgi:succinate-acetate transporter protein